MHDPLAPLLADGVVEAVGARLKTGKEAEVWLVQAGGEVVAAKVYKARQTRTFRNDAAYREGRRVRDSRTQRAMDRGSRFGQAAAEEAWKAREADALHALHAAGVRVPRPVLFYEGVLLMELVVGPDGHPAPRLVDAHVPRERAAALYADLRAQAVRMLCCDLIHGDLSPYNVLLGHDGPVVIDFPQVVGAAHNGQAEAFFRRDLENLRRFFAALDPALEAAAGDAREIWRAYVRRELTPDFVPSGRAPEPAPRAPAHPSGAGGRRGQPPRPHAAPAHAAPTPAHAAAPRAAPARDDAPQRRGPGNRRGSGPGDRGGRPADRGGRPPDRGGRPPERGGRPADRREHGGERGGERRRGGPVPGPEVIRVERLPLAGPRDRPGHAQPPRPASAAPSQHGRAPGSRPPGPRRHPRR
ncbi:RIO1 family regulatory kinase/ATPase [Anaeromyxobacter dehalogenans]|uniref:non-specific serine/threonine protein kinase n=1 Tax=Anaeromyxobacter dehalogenans (strain 2CP-C) TaxID=290397 RepID=Q2IJY2_ANADE|nr:RIO1 family regulatory kinase/ATPase [Anaeromyxobacter dehalogenans]ABC81965.1 protein of unknown function RIO1 [Anaeromyxobacter dehalogenans 2CP-C]